MQTRRMRIVRPAEDATPTHWLLESAHDSWDLVRYGPPGFETYVRVALACPSDPDDVGADESTVRIAFEVLRQHTATPGDAYAAIWKGWTSRMSAPQAPRVEIPNRPMLLFTGPVDALWNAPAVAWTDSMGAIGPAPHLAWPQDRAWCMACEVDEEIEFTVGCSHAAADAIATALPGHVRRVSYGADVPLYRDDP